MKSFNEFLNLFEAEPPMPNPGGGGGGPMGMDGGPPMGGSPMGGMGGPGGGIGGPPMGGMGGMGGPGGGTPPPKPPIELNNLDVWEVLDKLLNKSGNENKKGLKSQSPDVQNNQDFQLPPDQGPQFLQSIPGVGN